MRCALLNIWFGPLPKYFPFFAKSCLKNKTNFHWFLFTDQVKKKEENNESLTLIPYSWEDMKNEMPWFRQPNEIKSLQIWPKSGWPCRYALMWQRDWSGFDFVGTFDCDVVFGNLINHMPNSIHDYGMITAHSGAKTPKKRWRNCSAFSMFRKDAIKMIQEYKETSEDALDENFAFCDFFSQKAKIFHTGKNIQPLGESVEVCHLNMSYQAVWENGKLTVEGVEGGMWHLLPTKNHPDFRISISPKANIWHMSKFGMRGKMLL
jgi:hypothetical protein